MKPLVVLFNTTHVGFLTSEEISRNPRYVIGLIDLDLLVTIVNMRTTVMSSNDQNLFKSYNDVSVSLYSGSKITLGTPTFCKFEEIYGIPMIK